VLENVGDVQVILQPGKRVEAVRTALRDGWEVIGIQRGGVDGGKVITAYVMGKRKSFHLEVKTLRTFVGCDDEINKYLADGWGIVDTHVTREDFVVYILSRMVEREKSAPQPVVEFRGCGTVMVT
jgi:hypothetical protein